MDFEFDGKASWQAKPEGKMRVPIRVYASKPLFEKMRSDRTLSQAASVATLPGILKASLVMPDGHEGYGFPIGGVAAFDMEEGVVSPGGVGYDINCLCRGTKVLDADGKEVPIEKIGNGFEKLIKVGGYFLGTGNRSAYYVKTLDRTSGTPTVRPLLAFMKKKADKKTLEIETETGLKVRMSEDHPLLTEEGMKPAKFVSEGARIISGLTDEFCSAIPTDTIVGKRTINYSGWVYDLTVAGTHNFVANGIVV